MEQNALGIYGTYFLLAGIGAGLFYLFRLWRLMSLAWDSWFPLFKTVGQAAIWAGIVGGAGYGVYLVTGLANQALGAVALLAGIAVPALLPRATEAPDDVHERGARFGDAEAVIQQVKAQKKSYNLALGGVPIPTDVEPYHMLIAGATGSGKSVAIRTMLDSIRARGETVILVDSGGEFMTRYWNQASDYVLNPFDARCAPWSPLAEIEGSWDAEALARSIIPDGVGDSKEWNSYAQTFLSSTLQALLARNRASLDDLLWAVQSASIADLQVLLDGTPAKAQLGSEKTFGSIRTIVSNYMSSYNYLQRSDDPFSVRKFVNRADGGALFLTYREDQLDSLRNLISCVLDVASRAILSLDPSPTRRVWLIIDEFASIGKVQSIEAVATKARKVGGCLVLGLQSVSQLRERYGPDSAQTILSCLSTWLVLRATDSETAEYISKYLGEAEVRRSSEGQNTSEGGATSTSWNQQKAVQRLVLASEVQQLANLEGFLKLAGSYPLCPIKLGFPPKVAEKAISFTRANAAASTTKPGYVPPITAAPKAASPQPLAPRGSPVPRAPTAPVVASRARPSPVVPGKRVLPLGPQLAPQPATPAQAVAPVTSTQAAIARALAGVARQVISEREAPSPAPVDTSAIAAKLSGAMALKAKLDALRSPDGAAAPVAAAPAPVAKAPPVAVVAPPAAATPEAAPGPRPTAPAVKERAVAATPGKQPALAAREQRTAASAPRPQKQRDNPKPAPDVPQPPAEREALPAEPSVSLAVAGPVVPTLATPVAVPEASRPEVPSATPAKPKPKPKKRTKGPDLRGLLG